MKRLNRIKAILIHEFYITYRSVEVIMDVFFFPLISIIVFGYLAVYLSGTTNSNTANNLLFAMILWQLVYIVQYSISVGSLWSIWSKNLSNIFITPISLTEYMSAHIFSGVLKAIVVLLGSSVVSILLFDFNIYQIGLSNIFLFLVNLILFSISTGIGILGLIFRFGTRIQALAWSITFLFQPLTAAFYPVSVLPTPIQKIAYMLPPTYIFEALRASMTSMVIRWDLISISFLLNMFYLILSIFSFRYMYRKSKETGQFARNE